MHVEGKFPRSAEGKYGLNFGIKGKLHGGRNIYGMNLRRVHDCFLQVASIALIDTYELFDQNKFNWKLMHDKRGRQVDRD